MNIRHIATGLLVAGMVSGTAMADTTQDRLVEYGFLAEPVKSTTVVERERVATGSAGMEQAINLGFTPAETQVVFEDQFTRQSRDVELTVTQERLRELGLAARDLNFEAGSDAGDDMMAHTK